MVKFKSLQLALAFSICAAFAVPTTASAQKQKKISYAEAYKRCKVYLDKEKGGLSGGTTSEQHKMARGAACMRRFGYRL